MNIYELIDFYVCVYIYVYKYTQILHLGVCIQYYYE